MIIKALINGQHEFKLCSWSAAQFNDYPVLKIQCDDLKQVKQIFSKIELIEIYISDNFAGSYSQYDSFDSITYDGKVFVEHENIFAECMTILLRRTNLVQEVARLQEIVQPIINIDDMTADEYREYLLGLISEQCRQQIYEGTDIEMSDGTLQHYTYNAEDQQNLANAVAILMQVPELPAVPYHPSGELCRMFSRVDLLTIYLTLQVRLTYLTTRCNMFNMWIKSIETKAELLEINWQSELPSEYQQQLTAINAQAVEIMNAMKAKFAPPEENE